VSFSIRRSKPGKPKVVVNNVNLSGLIRVTPKKQCKLKQKHTKAFINKKYVLWNTLSDPLTH